ncbi:MAG: hypothetical protein LBT47_07675, partial [Deltaproteobacteria bacterium]|nr:hypothetical protein [Deltaproteobacteria bacterium]
GRLRCQAGLNMYVKQREGNFPQSMWIRQHLTEEPCALKCARRDLCGGTPERASPTETVA